MTAETNLVHESSPPVPPMASPSGYLGPAEIVELHPHDHLVLVKWNDRGERWRSWAVPALGSSGHDLQCGDTILLVSQNLADFYVIGLLRGRPTPKLQNPESQIECSGATASVSTGAAGHQGLEVRSPRGELVFEYEPQSGKTRVHVPAGDLEFVAPNGSIAFHSAKDIRFGAASVSLLSRWGACFGIFGADGRVKSAITMDPESLKLKTAELITEAEQAHLQITRTRLSGESLKAEVGKVELICRRFETLTEIVIEKAKNVYRTAEQLSQTHAGRLRTIVRDLCHLKTRKAILKADEDFKVDADKIHLG
jgi:uncharacterized protein DUF3540